MTNQSTNQQLKESLRGQLFHPEDATYNLLVKIKTKYDQKNLFRVNQNIKPKA